MELREYARAVRRHWFLILVAMALAVGVSALVSQRAAPTYRSTTVLFVADGEAGGDVDAKAQRLNSYVILLEGPRVAGAVATQLGLPVADVQAKMSAEVEPGTALLVVTATDGSAARAQDIVTAAAGNLVGLVKQLEAGQQGTAAPVTITVAQEPTTAKLPANLPRNLGFAAVLGLLVAAAGVALREAFGSTVSDEQDLRRFPEIEAVDVVGPDRRPGRGRLAAAGRDPDRAGAEAFRRLRTRLAGAKSAGRRRSGYGGRPSGPADVDRLPLIRSSRPGPGRMVFVLTSPNPGEGTAKVAVGLAQAFAETGSRVVLVDADLRVQRTDLVAEYEGREGLTEILAGRAIVEDVLRTWRDGRLWVLPAGAGAADPGELLAAPTLAETLRTLEEDFDVVIVSAPPLLPVADAAVLSTHVGGVLLVLRAGRTRVRHAEEALGILRDVDAPVAGVVLNSLRDRARRLGRPGGAEAAGQQNPAGQPDPADVAPPPTRLVIREDPATRDDRLGRTDRVAQEERATGTTDLPVERDRRRGQAPLG